jgi:hypothetical protein
MAGSFTDGAPDGAPSATDSATPEGVAYVSRRALDIWTAAAVALVGVIVSAESLTHDIGWNEAGPGSGYFPFRIGLLLTTVAAVQFALSARGERRGTGSATFVTREEFHRTLSVFWPTAALVAAMFVLGAYVPSAVYLAWMMRRHGGHGWLMSATYGAAVMATFYLIFDVWFRVPLARGPW